MSKAAVIVALAITLGGCVVIWGRGYHVEAESPAAVTIRYDSHFTSLAAVQDAAAGRCGRYGKYAVATGPGISAWGLTTVDFACTTFR